MFRSRQKIKSVDDKFDISRSATWSRLIPNSKRKQRNVVTMNCRILCTCLPNYAYVSKKKDGLSRRKSVVHRNFENDIVDYALELSDAISPRASRFTLDSEKIAAFQEFAIHSRLFFPFFRNWRFRLIFCLFTWNQMKSLDTLISNECINIALSTVFHLNMYLFCLFSICR